MVTAPAPEPAACLPVIDAWETGADRGGRAVTVGLLIFPRFRGTRGAFDAFAEKVRRADRARRSAGTEPPFVVAAFHPDGLARFAGPHQLVSFLRRAPDPLLQLVRAEALDGVKAGGADVSGAVAAHNHATLTAPGQTARFDAAIHALRADRDAAYARLGWT